jgi:hypothetical protein
MSASGGFAGSMVFGRWKGRPTVRQLVIPANPRSLDQENSRNKVRVAGIAQHWANLNTQLGDGRLVSDKSCLISLAPAGYAWNGNLADQMIGTGALTYAADEAAYQALTALQKTAWETFATTGVTNDFASAFQTGAGGVAIAAIPPGQVAFHYQAGLFHAGCAAAFPGAVPPSYV